MRQRLMLCSVLTGVLSLSVANTVTFSCPDIGSTTNPAYQFSLHTANYLGQGTPFLEQWSVVSAAGLHELAYQNAFVNDKVYHSIEAIMGDRALPNLTCTIGDYAGSLLDLMGAITPLDASIDFKSCLLNDHTLNNAWSPKCYPTKPGDCAVTCLY